jgi:radical SAM superfamily enzyme YgiQ (UPF0313 family)
MRLSAESRYAEIYPITPLPVTSLHWPAGRELLWH